MQKKKIYANLEILNQAKKMHKKCAQIILNVIITQ